MADFPDWTGSIVVVVAAGPSAAVTPIEPARGRARIIAVNSSWRLVPWADLLFACDASWWFHHQGVPEFTGLKFTSSPNAARRFGLQLFSTLGSNSGYRAIRLAQTCGAATILLVGFDMHVKAGVHWHEPHVGVLKNPNADSMKIWRDEIERDLKRRRFTARIINCTPGSALDFFPFMSLAEAVDYAGEDNGEGRADRARHTGLSR